MRKAFYADIVRAGRVALLAGPFKSEAIARKYERAAFNAAVKVDPWVSFDSLGVVSLKAIEGEPFPLGKLNDKLDIEPGDLLELEIA